MVALPPLQTSFCHSERKPIRKREKKEERQEGEEKEEREESEGERKSSKQTKKNEVRRKEGRRQQGGRITTNLSVSISLHLLALGVSVCLHLLLLRLQKRQGLGKMRRDACVPCAAMLNEITNLFCGSLF